MKFSLKFEMISCGDEKVRKDEWNKNQKHAYRSGRIDEIGVTALSETSAEETSRTKVQRDSQQHSDGQQSVRHFDPVKNRAVT